MQISPLHTLQFGLTGHIGKLKGSARSTGEGHFFQIPSHSKKRCPLKACERHNRQTITDCSFLHCTNLPLFPRCRVTSSWLIRLIRLIRSPPPLPTSCRFETSENNPADLCWTFTEDSQDLTPNNCPEILRTKNLRKPYLNMTLFRKLPHLPCRNLHMAQLPHIAPPID